MQSTPHFAVPLAGEEGMLNHRDIPCQYIESDSNIFWVQERGVAITSYKIY
jgi:hypothetical protein